MNCIGRLSAGDGYRATGQRIAGSVPNSGTTKIQGSERNNCH